MDPLTSPLPTAGKAESYTERIKPTKAKIHDSKRLLSDKYETNLQ